MWYGARVVLWVSGFILGLPLSALLAAAALRRTCDPEASSCVGPELVVAPAVFAINYVVLVVIVERRRRHTGDRRVPLYDEIERF